MDSQNASHFRFSAGDVKPMENANRANGLPVRCVKYLHRLLEMKSVFLSACESSPQRDHFAEERTLNSSVHKSA